MQMRRILIILSLLTLTAFKPYVGFSQYQINSTDKRFETIDKLKFNPTPSFGIITSYNRFIYSVSTNRIINFPTKFKVQSTKNNKYYDNIVNNDSDVVSIAYKFNRVNAGLFITNSRIEKKLVYQNETVSKEKIKTHFYGLTTGSFYKNIGFNVVVVAPNQPAKTGLSYGFNINYIF